MTNELMIVAVWFSLLAAVAVAPHLSRYEALRMGVCMAAASTVVIITMVVQWLTS
jgi:hypothetical protein